MTKAISKQIFGTNFYVALEKILTFFENEECGQKCLNLDFQVQFSISKSIQIFGITFLSFGGKYYFQNLWGKSATVINYF